MSRRDALPSSTAERIRLTSTTTGSGLAMSGAVGRARTLSASGKRCEPSSLAGYEALFDSATESMDSRYICPVCLTVLRQPVQTKCGHRFCKSCFSGSNAGQRLAKCPVDKTPLTDTSRDVFHDLAMEREVLSLPVRCSNCSIGCQWRGELRQLEEHRTKCQKEPMLCVNTGCSVVYKREDHKSHQRECSMRIQPCSHCGLDMLSAELAKHQLLACARFPVTCSLCGQTGIMREDIQQHCDSDAGTCPMSIVSCQFAAFGCNFQDLRKNLQSHLQSHLAMVQHLSLMKTVIELLLTTREQRHNAAEQLLPYTVQQNISDRLNNGRTVSYSSHRPDLILSNFNAEPASYDGRLLWKINLDLDETADSSSHSYRSPSFYTAHVGYRVHLVLEIPGHGRNKSTITTTAEMRFDRPERKSGEPSTNSTTSSLSAIDKCNDDDLSCTVFVCVERGQFDEYIRFPIDCCLTVALVNQAINPDDRINHQVSIVFHQLQRVSSTSVQQPGSDVRARANAVASADVSSTTSVGEVPANLSSASADDSSRCGLQLISLRRLLAGSFVHNGEVFIKAEVNHLPPFPSTVSGPPT